MQAAKDEAKAQGKELDVYAVGVVTCRPTQKEAEEYYHYATIENADWSAVDGILGKKNISAATVGEEEFQEQRHHYAHGMGGLLMVGDPDQIAQQARRSDTAGLRGIGFSFVNYLKELPYFCDEVLPRLERMGIRQKRDGRPRRGEVRSRCARLCSSRSIVFGLLGPAYAQDDVAAFYRGKQVRLVVGTAPGGGYDLFARIVARHIAAHIPGQPTVIVQNRRRPAGWS